MESRFIPGHGRFVNKRLAIMEVMMQERDKRAVESMCRCGLDIDGVIAVFLKFSRCGKRVGLSQ